MPTPDPTPRIHSLTADLARLRTQSPAADPHAHQLLIKMTEIQLTLAHQDKTLVKLDAAINGNGRLGLLTRVDRLERTIAAVLRFGWLLIAAAATATLDLALHLPR